MFRLTTSLLTLAFVAPALFAQDADDNGNNRGVLEDVTGGILVNDGGIQAPEQPLGRSSASLRRTPRTELRGKAGRFGQVSSRIGSLVQVRGLEDNVISGYGLVVGLSGTGDSSELSAQMLRNLLLTGNLNIDPSLLASENIAVVHVEASLPAGTKQGQKIDARVSAIGDAESLQGGNLVETELFGPAQEYVYATVSGPLTVGGYTVSGDAATVKKNHTTVATMAQGATVHREIPTSVVSENGFIYLDMRNAFASLGNSVRVSESVERLFPSVSSVLPDGRTVRITVPGDLPEKEYVAYLDMILQQEVVTESLPRVVINERTGTIVMGGDVRIRGGVVGNGSLLVKISESPQASQPGPLSEGETTVLPRTDLEVEEENNPLVAIPDAATLEEVVEVLNLLGASPRDLIYILTEMSNTGVLIAELRRM